MNSGNGSWRARSNRAPFTDLCVLVWQEISRDAEGYEIREEMHSEVFCNILRGAVRSEFYEAYRSGVRLDLTVEVWEDDYANQTILDHGGARYEVIRGFPTGRGTVELVCKEVLR